MGLALVPQPRSLAEADGAVAWSSRWRCADAELRDAVAASLGALGATLDDDEGAVGDDVTRVSRASDLGPEEYRLRVDDAVHVEAGGPAGAYYACVTLAQMLEDAAAGGSPGRLARVAIDDGPTWRWRGVHLDVARHFFSLDDVLRFIDLAAAHKLNRLHLHLNDDQGWRVEVPGWPALTEVGAWRSSSPVGHERDGVDDHVAHGGFYRASDLTAMREHAERRFVTIVPEIDLPGHAQSALAAYPALGTGEPCEVWTRWGISERVLNVSDSALDFAVDVTSYVAGLFPGNPVHIGGDECPTTQWSSDEDAQTVMARHGFADPRQLQGLFTSRVAAALRERGHEVLAWDEVLDAEVPAGTVVVAWRGASHALAAARRGYDIVVAPMQFLYFDWLSSDAPGEPVAQNPAPLVTTWQKVYGFRVLPDGLEPALAHHVRGAQAQLWTEYIATRDHLDYMAFPRLSAFAEVVWGTAQSREEFTPRLERHLARLGARGVRFRPLDWGG